MRRDRQLDSSGRTLLVAFAVVAAAFMISTAVAEWSDVSIRRAAEQIAGETSPSVEHLSLLRADLRRITLLGDGDLDAALEGRPPFERTRIDGALTALERDWNSYRALPAFPGESALVPAAEQAQRDLATAIARLERIEGDPDRTQVRAVLEKELQPAANRLDNAVLRLIDLNAARGGQLGRAIGRLGRESVINAVVLDAICVLLTVAAGLLAWRLVRRTTALLEQRADELEAFAGRVAHDVMGPLTATSLALDLLARGTASPERAARALESGRAGVARARLIADGLLAFARAGARPEAGAEADVAEVIAGTVKEIAPAAGEKEIAIAAELSAPGAAACNPGVLASLVSNLLRNAVKYAGGVPAPRIVVRARALDDALGRARVRIEVEDNGPGLPAALGDRVFEPYVRGPGSGKPGIGLGLATVKRIADAHGGRVGVRSAPGQGCTFAVELPAAPRLRMPRAVGADALPGGASAQVPRVRPQ
ncbi:MAG TPA: HAMP domain-containing sensor histidine kinase [Polyangia bacterium]|nr:HAMP domain-containing sensor histidine kinase [Polyangia bacterium]